MHGLPVSHAKHLPPQLHYAEPARQHRHPPYPFLWKGP
jgi:hypothetical protein